MDIEEVFLQLCEELTRLQDLCTKQALLLQKLTARNRPVLDLPVSLPIQCTEDMVPEEGERPLDGHQKGSETLVSAASKPLGSAHPLPQPHAASALPASDSQSLASTASSSALCAGTGGAALAMAFGSSKAERGEEVDVDTWLKSYRITTMKTPKEETRACCSPQELAAPKAAVLDSFLTLLDLSEGPEAPGREDAPSQSALPAEAEVPVEIRGPTKMSWTPGWVLEDQALGQGALLSSESAQACDICQELYPSDAAGQVDSLKHILTYKQ